MHILSPETDNCPSWISGRERMTLENISWSISTKECCRPRRGLNPRPPGLQSDGAPNWATEAGLTVLLLSPLSLTLVLLNWEHCLAFIMWICIKSLDQANWLADSQKWTWHLNLFSMAWVHGEIKKKHLSEYGKCPKISYTKVSDKMAYANSADPDPEGAV